ncbi:UNVERIFIED_CONTAM: hypothetical protein ABID98_001869 [Brevibacillus sp. OAP136]
MREKLNNELHEKWKKSEISREANEKWSDEAKMLHGKRWENRINRQKEIDTSIAAKADLKDLYDKPYEDKKKVRVAGPFTVESISPHRVLAVDENDEFITDIPGSKAGFEKEQVLKARMNADLHMADNLKNTGIGNLFVIFGEPDIEIIDAGDGKILVKINGVDVFHPNFGEIRSDGPEGIACWFIDTDYNEESFFVRHAYFFGLNDPYKALKTTLKAEINVEAWETVYSDISRPFILPKSGRIAIKVINHLGEEVMKVFRELYRWKRYPILLINTENLFLFEVTCIIN